MSPFLRSRSISKQARRRVTASRQSDRRTGRLARDTPAGGFWQSRRGVPIRFLLSGLVCIALPGCFTSRAALELCESQLRRSEERIAALEREKQRLSRELERVRQINETLYARSNGEDDPLLPERLNALYRLTSVEILPLFSGVRDEDGQPGAETLYVVVVPRDENGNTVALPGRVTLEARAATPASSAEDGAPASPGPRLGRWDYSISRVRSLWVSRLFGSGFQFVQQLAQPPNSDTIEVAVRFETADGRTFADRQAVRVHDSPPAALAETSGRSGKPARSAHGAGSRNESRLRPSGTDAPRDPSPSAPVSPAIGTPEPQPFYHPVPTNQTRSPAPRSFRPPQDPGIAGRRAPTEAHDRTSSIRNASVNEAHRAAPGGILPSSAEHPATPSPRREDTSDVWKARDIPVLR